MKTLEQMLQVSDEGLRHDWAFTVLLQIVWDDVEEYVEFIHKLLIQQQQGQLLYYQVKDAFYIEFMFKLMPQGAIEWLLTLMDDGEDTREWLAQHFMERSPELAAKFFGVSVECIQAWARGEDYED
jgi:hypothetical protein